MTLMEVTNLGQSEDPKKKVYSVTLKSVYEYTVEIKITLKSEFKAALERIVPLVVGTRRDLDILDPNRKLDDFVAPEQAKDLSGGNALVIDDFGSVSDTPFSEEDL